MEILGVLRWLDIPPTWLLVALGATFGLDRWLSWPGFGAMATRWIGEAVILAGLGTMAAALWEFIREKTSFIPRRKPSAFIKGGIYRLTRNPIYLGDALVLGGAILAWDVPWALPLVPLFAWFISRRFIRGEEAGLIAAFGDEAQEWFGKVRRWL